MKKHTKYLLLISFLTLLFGCDLPLQDNYDFNPELNIVDPWKDSTAWEFFNSPLAQRTGDEGQFLGDNYNYLVAAIEKAGFVELYNQTSNANRTYLMLNNNAFTGGGDVIEIITGSWDEDLVESETPEETMARVDTPEKMEKLRTVLRYHIVDAYVDQIPTLRETFTQYIFQTLVPGEAGLIAFLRDDRYRTEINDDRRAPLPFPSSATSQRERIRNSNYIFINGIGHSLNDPVRNLPY
ncbi:hypothetical protein FGM00_05210 [Aggregatimonas sangjinii]|uniref:FAS1 domain-containing protein n=1 Tax=Aggregatimonas sangjinii TaxID=2583587 RepID=A0A5B7SM41_9FLAO|nr:hypothetical protein [Aggregatimonas sangjinii]QCW99536.1 hypothetical protein FGM00_05210 [Aggregatimonas sangjinii]